MTKWQTLLRDLRERGWTQDRLSTAMGTSQSTISDLNSGKTKDPSHSLGVAVEALHASGKSPDEAPVRQAA